VASGWPKLADVRGWLRMQPDATSDAIIDEARLAAVAYGVARLGTDATSGLPIYPSDTTSLPDDCFLACVMHAAKLFRRRDTVDGLIGWGDVAAMRVGRTDPDVDALYSGYAPLVFG